MAIPNDVNMREASNLVASFVDRKNVLITDDPAVVIVPPILDWDTVPQMKRAVVLLLLLRR